MRSQHDPWAGKFTYGIGRGAESGRDGQPEVGADLAP